ncbi:hypothetical protein RhiirC2_777559 [Rhizophagus irregularis]|uniref:Uncharacterized protein n=1 Tax=Rhizophagus irregularis TaxID=588596 RepID=A0A2N1NDW8_9GLOM|nr:hypothetical protein RhiirC2_777559 [Rhizophagus irregularis]
MYVNIIQVKFQGCDCHGLSIELKALTELRDVDKSSLMTLQIREVAKVDFRLMNTKLNSYRCFICTVEKGSRKITALAEAELEYRDDYQNKSVYIQSSHKLIGTTYIRPISEKQCSVIDASHITEESGTGHGIEDYEACRNALLQKGINILMIGEQKAKSYTSMEWFANVEATKQQAMKLFENVKWHLNLVNKTVIPLLTDSSIEHIIEIFKKHESVGWWELDDQELLAPEYKNNVAVNDKVSYSTLIAHGFVMDVLAILEKSSKSRD